MKSNLSLMILFSVTALLGLYSFGALQKDYRTSDRVFSEKFLEQLESVKIKLASTEIELSKSTEELSFGLDKKIHPGQWLVSGQVMSMPNIAALNQLFSGLANLKVLNQVDSGALTEFGLKEPHAILEVRSGSEKKRLKIGSVNSISKRRYAQFDGEQKVVLLDDGQVSGLLKLELRDLRPLKIPSENVSKFAIEGKSTKIFSRRDGLFEIAGERNLDSGLVESYLQELLVIPARQTVNLESLGGKIYAKLSVDWRGLPGNSELTEAVVYSLDDTSFFLKLPSVSAGYEYGPEFGRLLNRKLERFYNLKLLRNIKLSDFFESCPNMNLKVGCQPTESAINSFQDIFQRVEVLDLESLPGRLMTPLRPECRLKLGSSKVLFEIGPAVSSDGAPTEDSPHLFVSDIGADHYRGVISGPVARDFCLTVNKLCSEAKIACEG